MICPAQLFTYTSSSIIHHRKIQPYSGLLGLDEQLYHTHFRDLSSQVKILTKCLATSFEVDEVPSLGLRMSVPFGYFQVFLGG